MAITNENIFYIGISVSILIQFRDEKHSIYAVYRLLIQRSPKPRAQGSSPCTPAKTPLQAVFYYGGVAQLRERLLRM